MKVESKPAKPEPITVKAITPDPAPEPDPLVIVAIPPTPIGEFGIAQNGKEAALRAFLGYAMDGSALTATPAELYARQMLCFELGLVSLTAGRNAPLGPGFSPNEVITKLMGRPWAEIDHALLVYAIMAGLVVVTRWTDGSVRISGEWEPVLAAQTMPAYYQGWYVAYTSNPAAVPAPPAHPFTIERHG